MRRISQVIGAHPNPTTPGGSPLECPVEFSASRIRGQEALISLGYAQPSERLRRTGATTSIILHALGLVIEDPRAHVAIVVRSEAARQHLSTTLTYYATELGIPHSARGRVRAMSRGSQTRPMSGWILLSDPPDAPATPACTPDKNKV